MDPQKRTPNGNVCRLQGKPHFGTEMLLKPLVFARAEVARSISTFEIASHEALRLDGEMLTLDIYQQTE